MASPTLNLVIDARPRGPRGLLAAEVVLGRAVLSRLVDQALEAIGPGGTLTVRGLAGDRDELAPLLADAGERRIEATHVDGAPEGDFHQWVFNKAPEGRSLIARGVSPWIDEAIGKFLHRAPEGRRKSNHGQSLGRPRGARRNGGTQRLGSPGAHAPWLLTAAPPGLKTNAALPISMDSGGETRDENCPPGQPAAAVLRTDRLYDSRRLGKILRRGGEPEAAVIWRLDRPEALEAAEQELTRRLTYQPIGRYWAFPIAERIAETLAPTRVRPNAVTLAAAALMFLGIALIAIGETGWPGRTITAFAFAAALVLDTADGRLARLQGTHSEFGRWLDEVLDELADLALHAAIAWMMFQATGSALWLALGMLYASGKYMFVVQSLSGASMEKAEATAATSQRARPSGFVAPIRRLIAALGHADLRWHLWIVLALVGRLDAALWVYALYFPFRAAAGIARKGVARG